MLGVSFHLKPHQSLQALRHLPYTDHLTRSRRAWQAKADQAAARGRRLPGTPPDPPDQALPVLRAEHALDTARENATLGNAARQNPPTGPPGKAATPGKANRHNITDPDSRIMPTRNGWVQGYNAHLAVTADWLVLGVTLTQNPADTGLPPRFRTPALIGSGPEWRMGNVRTAQEVFARV